MKRSSSHNGGGGDQARLVSLLRRLRRAAGRGAGRPRDLAAVEVLRETRHGGSHSSTCVIEAPCDLKDTRALVDFHERCESAIRSSRSRARLDLQQVQRADSKLVASLIAIARLARAANVSLKLQSSPVVQDWIDFYKVGYVLH